MDGPLILRLLAASVSVAGRAGRIIRQVMASGNLGVVDKGKNDLQTQADRSAQRCIVSSLQRKFPGLCIIGEETLEASAEDTKEIEEHLDGAVLEEKCPENLAKVSLEQIVVWVDPLDGTAEFTQGLLDNVTVLIGVAVSGRAVGGVVYQPYYGFVSGQTSAQDCPGRCVWALEGVGIRGIAPVSLPDPSFEGGLNLITTTRSHSSPIVGEAVEACKASTVIRAGGCGYKVLLLLEGKAHAYVFASHGCKKWDTCAPEAILHSSGGLLTDIRGDHYEYHSSVDPPNKRGVLATGQMAWHAKYKQLIPQHVIEKLV